MTLLGYKFWQREFGGDPGVIGRKLLLNDKMRTIIGVMPQRFMWRGADVYLPDVFHRGQDVEGVHDVDLMARLKPGVTLPQAQADMRPIIEELAQRYPSDFPKKWRVELRTFKETFPSGITDALWILFGAVGLLLVIACVNVSNLLLSRAAYRRREIAVRAWLGAGRSRLVTQLLAESLVLAAAGGALGVVVAFLGLRGIIAMVPPNTIPDEAHIALNAPVLLFTLAVSVTAAILFGLAPALQLSGRDTMTPLKEAGRGTSGGVRQRFTRSILVVGEVALSLMLLVGASLMIRTLVSCKARTWAFAPTGSSRCAFRFPTGATPTRRGVSLSSRICWAGLKGFREWLRWESIPGSHRSATGGCRWRWLELRSRIAARRWLTRPAKVFCRPWGFPWCKDGSLRARTFIRGFTWQW